MPLCKCGCGIHVGGTWKRGHNPGTAVPAYLEEDTGYSSPCWIWQRGQTGGYGRISRLRYGSKRSGLVHKVEWEETYGPLPSGKVLDHLCRISLCVNPNHLEPVTQAENIQRGYDRLRDEWTEMVRALLDSPLEEHRKLGQRIKRRAELSPRWKGLNMAQMGGDSHNN